MKTCEISKLKGKYHLKTKLAQILSLNKIQSNEVLVTRLELRICSR